MQIIYVADDGSEFETEQECNEYENRYNGLFAAFDTDIVAFDDNNERLTYKPDVNPDDMFGEIKYIMFKTEEIIPVFLDARKNYFGYDTEGLADAKPGVVYAYDFEHYMWHNIDDELAEIMAIKKLFEEDEPRNIRGEQEG